MKISNKLYFPSLLFSLFAVGSFAEEAKLRWTKELPARQPKWDFVKDMQKDSGYRPTAAGGKVFVGCEHNNALLALSAKTGEELWKFYTNGPIRTQATTDKNRVIFGSDDGFIYCLNHDGKLIWKAPAGNGQRFVIGHGRLMSAWPIPTHPLLLNGKLYVMGGCWPADGVFMNCFDAENGKLLWRSPSMAMRAMMIPHFIMDGKVHVRTYSGTGGKAAAFDLDTGAISPWPKGFKTPPPERPTVPGGKDITSSNTSRDFIFGSGKDGTIFCAGPSIGTTPINNVYSRATAAGDVESANAILKVSGQSEGYALVSGLNDGSIIEGLLHNSNFYIVGIDPDEAKVNRIRRELDSRGAFDTRRLNLMALTLKEDVLPPYFANIVLSEAGSRAWGHDLASLRPYGGAEVYKENGKWKAKFRGKLEGAGDWSHEYANAAMNNSSGDSLVKGTLGILWYGGPASDQRYYMGGSRPTGSLVVEGRMFLQGNGVIAAIDAYNGRLLWETETPKIYFYSASHSGNARGLSKSTPWDDPKANEKADIPNTHRPRSTGLNWAATADTVYLFAGQQCIRIDAKTGKQLPAWDMPLPKDHGETLCWGHPRIVDDILVATAFRPIDMKHAKIGSGGNGGDWSGDRMPMSQVFAVDRKSGKLLWSHAANHGFNNRAFVASKNRVFLTDLLQTNAYLNFKEKGRKLNDAPFALRAFDLQSGKPTWSKELKKLIKYISYDSRIDRLYVPNRYGRTWTEEGWGWPGIDSSVTRKKSGRPNGVFRAFEGTSGKQLWEVSERHYDGPFTITANHLLNRYGSGFDPETGLEATRVSPITGQEETFGLKKSGCAVLGACDTLVAWRTAYHNLSTATSTQLPGFEAGCTTSLLPAGGLLNMPNFGMFHLRARAAAVAMVERPSAETWSSFQYTKLPKETFFEKIGFNFGAPGDRYDENGTLWVKAFRGGDFRFQVEPREEAQWFVTGLEENWITKSGVEGVTEIVVPTAINQKSNNSKSKYDIKLYFPIKKGLKPGQNVFDISIEGKPVAKDFDMANAQIFSAENLDIQGRLDIEFSPKAGKAAISGVEIVRTN